MLCLDLLVVEPAHRGRVGMRGLRLGIGMGMVLAIGCLQSEEPCEGPRVHLVDGECVPRDATDTGDESDADTDADTDTDSDEDDDEREK